MSTVLEPSPEGIIQPRKSYDGAPRFGAAVWLGLGLCTAAAILAAIPGIWPDAMWIQTVATKQGSSPALLVTAGVGCLAIGLGLRRLARWQAAALDAQSERADPLTPQLQKIGSELSQVRGSLDELRIEHVYVKDGVKRLDAELQEQLATANPQSMQEAMFRMAGSLDQVGARLDERLSMQNDSFQETLRTFHDSLLRAIVRLDELHGRIAPYGSARPASERALDADGAPEAAPSLGVLDQISDAPGLPSLPVLSNGPAAPLPNQSAADVALAHKIAQLTRLMADADVQQVLHGLPIGSATGAPAVVRR